MKVYFDKMTVKDWHCCQLHIGALLVEIGTGWKNYGVSIFISYMYKTVIDWNF